MPRAKDNRIEPGFLDRLPPRFRRRYRENIAAAVVLIALFVLPQHVGRFGLVTGLTIIWLANSAFYLSRLLPAPRSRSGLSLCLLMIVAFAYPLGLTWQAQAQGEGAIEGAFALGTLGFLVGVIALIILMIAQRRVLFPSLFGSERRNLLREFADVREAQREERRDRSGSVSSLDDRRRNTD